MEKTLGKMSALDGRKTMSIADEKETPTSAPANAASIKSKRSRSALGFMDRQRIAHCNSISTSTLTPQIGKETRHPCGDEYRAVGF